MTGSFRFFVSLLGFFFLTSEARAQTPGAPVAAAAVVGSAPRAAPGSAPAGQFGAPAGQSGGALAADSGQVEALVTAARERQIARSAAWRRLVHYRRGVLGGQMSQGDGPEFFLSPEGVKDPEAELEAMIRAMYAPPGEPDTHAICRFPARAAFVQRALGLDRLPAARCDKLRAYWAKVQPHSITIVFSSYYLNNPASVFGHTFLRFNKDSAADSDENRALLDLGVNYSATVAADENPFIYSVKGLFGLYHGDFQLMPYYYKVREYNDFESRDLWEYELSLTPEQVELVAAHIWELGGTYFDYYYLSENCSYHVLSALEVANPALHLVDDLRWPVVPSETVKALVRAPGLVRQIHFRPSLRSTFRARVKGMGPPALAAVSRLALDPEAPVGEGMSGVEQAAVFDAAVELVEMRHAKEILASHDSRAAGVKQRLLERRAELDAESTDLVIATPEDEMPHKGHGVSRFGFGAGVERPGSALFQLEWRLALRDLADAPAGYPEYAQLEFFPIRMRYHTESQKLRLEDLSLVRILSLNPVENFNVRPSWKVRLGATTFRDKGCAECTYGLVEFGSGIAANFLGEHLTAWATLDLGLYGPRFLGPADSDRGRIQIGPAAGARVSFHRRLHWVTTGSWSVLPIQSHPRFSHELTSVLRWNVAGDFAVGAEGRLQPDSKQLLASTFLYF
jgi:hypothetical protein